MSVDILCGQERHSINARPGYGKIFVPVTSVYSRNFKIPAPTTSRSREVALLKHFIFFGILKSVSLIVV